MHLGKVLTTENVVDIEDPIVSVIETGSDVIATAETKQVTGAAV